MRRRVRTLRATLAILAGSLFVASTATADQASELLPIQLRVLDQQGIADGWHSERSFALQWIPPPVSENGFPVMASHRQLYSVAGVALGNGARTPGDATYIPYVQIPSSLNPGVYKVGVRLEGPGRQLGPEVSADVRFDNARPGPAQPLPPAGWVAGNAAAVIAIERPSEPLPISGIRGYAISVDRGSGSVPCAKNDRCSLAETDVRTGIDGGRVSLGVLPEGPNVVRAVAVTNSGVRSAEARSAIVRVDATRPEVTLRGAPRDWANGPVRVTASATDGLSGMAANGPSGPFTAIATDGGVPRRDPGDSAAVVVSGQGSHNVASFARDAAGNVDATAPTTTAVRIDETPPQVAFFAAQDPAEPERMEAIVADSLSGPDPARGSISVRPARSRQPFARLPTAVAGNRLVARWDSDAFPPGAYEFRATGYDAAGNASSSERRATGARLVLTNPLKRPTAIVAGFGGKRLVWQRCSRRNERRRCRREEIKAFEERPKARAAPYGRSLSYGGRLSSPSGFPLRGQQVQIVETFGAGFEQHTTTVETGPDGAFLARLEPGPSRHVEAVFAGNRTLARASGGKVRLRVLGDVRMHASSSTARIGGAPIVLSGSIGDLGAPIPAGGRPIELQFRFPGSKWAEFRTVQTDSHGRFRYIYAFSDDDSRGVRFQFRAYAPAQPGWPYEPAFSRPVFVTGR